MNVEEEKKKVEKTEIRTTPTTTKVKLNCVRVERSVETTWARKALCIV
jgi:hypothetical protein